MKVWMWMDLIERFECMFEWMELNKMASMIELQVKRWVEFWIEWTNGMWMKLNEK